MNTAAIEIKRIKARLTTCAKAQRLAAGYPGHDRDRNAANNLVIQCFSGPMVGGPWTLRANGVVMPPDEASSESFTLGEKGALLNPTI
jgi:hypothetical protein